MTDLSKMAHFSGSVIRSNYDGTVGWETLNHITTRSLYDEPIVKSQTITVGSSSFIRLNDDFFQPYPQYSLTFTPPFNNPALKLEKRYKDKQRVAVVTGFAGFIGSHFAKRLLNDGWFVYGIDKNHSTDEEFQSKNFKHFGSDICDLKELPDCDYVFHFAAETHVHNAIQDCKEFIRTNIEGTRNLLELVKCKPNNVVQQPIFYYISTDEVYGDIPSHAKGATEEHMLAPTNNYSVTKAAADMLVQSYQRTYGFESVIVRLANNYGTHQCAEKLLPLTIKLLLWGKSINLHNYGKPVRCWLHVDDTVDAILTMVKRNVRGIFNVAGNDSCTNRETVQLIANTFYGKVVDLEELVNFEFIRPGQDMNYKLDDSKLKMFGWRPQRKLVDNIGAIVQWYLQNPEERLF